jgi:hypothetical protein
MDSGFQRIMLFLRSAMDRGLFMCTSWPPRTSVGSAMLPVAGQRESLPRRRATTLRPMLGGWRDWPVWCGATTELSKNFFPQFEG